MTAPYPPFIDPVITPEQEVRYSYWPVSYQFGDPTVISNSSLPLSGVKFSEIMRGVGELRATLQLAEEEVRAAVPWEKIIPRKTGIVVVREFRESISQAWVSTPVQHYIVWSAPRDPSTGRMSITAHTVESLWARRLITKAITWDNVDQTIIAGDLLDPATFSQIPLGGGLWTGWVNVDPPLNLTGVTRDFTYKDRQETNLLEAHQKRSQLSTNSYEWRTSVRVLDGDDAVSANTFRVLYVLGFPQLGRQLGDIAPVPRLRYDSNGGGNVLDYDYNHDGSQMANIVWGRGNGYEDNQVKALVQFNEWQHGFLQTEARFSDADVKLTSTLEDYCLRQIYEQLGSEQFISKLSVRGDHPPYFGTYVIGDDVILETNDLTWHPDMYNTDGFVELATRIFGWVVTPPQPGQAETVELLVPQGSIT